MSDDLRRAIETFPDERLVRILHVERDQYTPDALRAVEDELSRRSIAPEAIEEMKRQFAGPVQYKREDFVPFDHTFSQTDLLLARAILAEHEIPFFADNPQSSDIMPTQGLAEQTFRIHIHRDHADRVHALLDEHFSRDGGAYRLKELSLRDQLKLMNFYEIKLDEKQMLEEVDIELSAEERRVLAKYARRLSSEADHLEQEQERTVFYYDSLDALCGKLEASGGRWTVADVLSMLEVVQIYCDDPQFPPSMDQTLKGLLEFFRSISDR